MSGPSAPWLLLVAFAHAALGCQASSVHSPVRPAVAPAGSSNSPAESKVTQFGVSEPVLRLMTSVGAHPAQLYGANDDGDDVRLAGVTVEVSPDRSHDVVRTLRRRLPPGHMMFVRDQSFGVAGKPDLVAAMKATDMYAVIAAIGTNGWNYDIGPKQIIERLRDWDHRYGLTLIGAGFDWLNAEFVHPPADMPAFAAEVYRFCPDIVDQGTETVQALAEEMRRTNSVYLWWD